MKKAPGKNQLFSAPPKSGPYEREAKAGILPSNGGRAKKIPPSRE